MSIKVKLTLSTIAVFLLLVIIIGAVFFSVMKTTLISEAMYDAGQACRQAAYSLENSILSDTQIIKTIAAGNVFLETTISDKLSAIQNHVRISQYEYIVIQWDDDWYRIFADGYEAVASPTGISQETNGVVLFGYLFAGEEEGVLIIEPVSSEGRTRGRIIAKRSAEWAASFLSFGSMKKQTSIVLSESEGQIIYPEDTGLTVSVFNVSDSQDKILINGSEQREYSGVSVTLSSIALDVSAYVDMAKVSANLNQYVLYYMLLALGSLLMISAIVYVISSLLTRSIVELAGYTAHFELPGDRIPHEFTKRTDETGVLARSFALLINKLNNSMGKMKHMAYHDSLTGLKNRYSLERDIEEMIRMNKPFAFALLDIDDFKIINDMMGHAEGDRLLTCIARIFKNLVSDTLDVYRWGGDEFAFLLTGDDTESYRTDIEKVLNEVSQRFDSSSKWRISVSAGVCTYPQSASDYSRLLALADQALILAKRSGKARFRFYEDI